MCVLYTPRGVAVNKKSRPHRPRFPYFNSHGKDSAVYTRNRAESIKKSHIPHDCRRVYLNRESDEIIFWNSSEYSFLFTSLAEIKTK